VLEDPRCLSESSRRCQLYGVSVQTVRLDVFRTFPAQAHLLRPEQRPVPDSQPVKAGLSRAERTWAELSKRQRAILVACYRQDRKRRRGEAEAYGGAGSGANRRGGGGCRSTIKAIPRSPATPDPGTPYGTRAITDRMGPVRRCTL